jgi:hypothetical protein
MIYSGQQFTKGCFAISLSMKLYPPTFPEPCLCINFVFNDQVNRRELAIPGFFHLADQLVHSRLLFLLLAVALLVLESKWS